MFYLLSKTLDVFLSPVAWALCLLLGALALHTEARKATRRILIAAALFVLYAFSTRTMESALLGAAERSAEDTRRPDVTYDAVVVLGGVLRDPGPGESVEYGDAVDRLIAAFDVLKRGQAKSAILSGGRPLNGVSEAVAMRDQLISWGIEADRLILDESSLNTRDNAVTTRAIVDAHGFRSLLLVTSAFHMLRSVECFRAVGLEVDTLPADYLASGQGGVLPRAQHLAGSELAIRELAGRIIYRARGYSVAATRN